MIPLSQAAKLAGVTRQTMSNWCNKIPNLGVKVVGRWRVNSERLEALLSGNML